MLIVYQDFRSSDGLYALVKERYPDVVMKGRDLFDASLFRDPTSTAVFYTFISGLKRSIDAAKPSPTHHFIKTLDLKKKLLRSYTQNIDGMEAQVGLLGSSCQEARSDVKGNTKLRVKNVRNVQLHGDIHRVRCMACSAEYPCTNEHLAAFEMGNAPDCPECLSRCLCHITHPILMIDTDSPFTAEARVARSARATRVGSLRPAIVLYDENHPFGDEIGAIHTADLARKPDMLIIMGTSLKVHGLKKLVKDFARTTHSCATSGSRKPFKVLFVNKTPPGAEWSDIIDYHISGETDQWSNRVIEDWKKMRPADWETQQTLIADDAGTSLVGRGLKTVKSSAKSATKLRKPLSERQNIGPIPSESPRRSTARETKPVPPLSPSKRRQMSSHYGDLESSPSKRRTTSEYHNVMPASERRMLFTEKTNRKVVPGVRDVVKSKMDFSLCDLSMRDVKGTDMSKMDISLLELSMIDVECPVEEIPPPKTRGKARSKVLDEKKQMVARRVTSQKKKALRTGAR